MASGSTPILFKKSPSEWIEGEIPVFSPRSEEERQRDRYDRDFGVIDLYTGLAYGKLLFQEEGAEPLYRTLGNLLPADAQQVLEVGCGVGRLLYDWAPERPDAAFAGIDLSYHMCLRSHQILRGAAPVPLPAWEYRGRRGVTFREVRYLENVVIAQASALDLPFPPMSFDVVAAALVLCRLAEPERGLAEMVRVLRPGGLLLAATPLGFNSPELWDRLAPEAKMRELFASFGLRIEHWIESLIYREAIDVRGNVHEWNVRVVAARSIA